MSKQNYTAFGELMAAMKSKDITDEKFVLMLFPCNQFLGQEPGKPETSRIRRLSTGKGDSELDIDGKNVMLMNKVDVNGKKADPIFEFLRYNSRLYKEGKDKSAPVPWNFYKWLVDKEGHVFKLYEPTVNAIDILDDIQSLLSDAPPRLRSRRRSVNSIEGAPAPQALQALQAMADKDVKAVATDEEVKAVAADEEVKADGADKDLKAVGA
jgi:glutathione peroxidase-family protein